MPAGAHDHHVVRRLRLSVPPLPRPRLPGPVPQQGQKGESFSIPHHPASLPHKVRSLPPLQRLPRAIPIAQSRGMGRWLSSTTSSWARVPPAACWQTASARIIVAPSCCWKPAPRTARCGSTSPPASPSCSTTRNTTGISKASRSPTPTTAASPSRAAAPSAAQAPSTACSTSAATRSTTIPGRSSVTVAGATTRCCPISARRNTSPPAATTPAAAAARLNVEHMRERAELLDAFIDAAVDQGYPRNKDYNNGHQEGFGYFQVTQKNGERWSCARGYLDPIRNRPNLKIETEALHHEDPAGGQARRRRRLHPGRRRQGSPRQPRGHHLRRRRQIPPHPGTLRHRQPRPASPRSASRSPTRCPASAKTIATTTPRA